jgi:hypothetical protein
VAKSSPSRTGPTRPAAPEYRCYGGSNEGASERGSRGPGPSLGNGVCAERTRPVRPPRTHERDRRRVQVPGRGRACGARLGVSRGRRDGWAAFRRDGPGGLRILAAREPGLSHALARPDPHRLAVRLLRRERQLDRHGRFHGSLELPAVGRGGGRGRSEGHPGREPVRRCAGRCDRDGHDEPFAARSARERDHSAARSRLVLARSEHGPRVLVGAGGARRRHGFHGRVACRARRAESRAGVEHLHQRHLQPEPVGLRRDDRHHAAHRLHAVQHVRLGHRPHGSRHQRLRQLPGPHARARLPERWSAAREAGDDALGLLAAVERRGHLRRNGLQLHVLRLHGRPLRRDVQRDLRWSLPRVVRAR